MKKLFNWALVAVLAMMAVGCGVHRAQAYYDYKSKVIEAHQDGSYVIRAWGRSRNATMSYEVAQKQALRDVLFNGVQAQSSNIQDLKPLIFDMNAQTKYEDYFNAFFSDHGAWKDYCSMVDRRIFTSNYSRTDAQLLAQVTVTIYRAQLKQKLIEDGILAQ